MKKSIRRRNRRASRRNRNEIPLLSIPFRQLRNRFAPLEVISEEQVEQVHEASMQILEDVGLRWLDDEALDLWRGDPFRELEDRNDNKNCR